MQRDGLDYEPRMDSETWAQIRTFVVTCVDAVVDVVPYSRQTLLTALAHHVAWVWLQAGSGLDPAQVFTRRMVGASVAAMKPATASTMGRRRSILLRVGEVVGAIQKQPELPRLTSSTSTTPYTTLEITRLRAWASLQGAAGTRESLRALLALGFGAGLLTRELCEVRSIDVGRDGRAVRVLGDRERIVPVVDPWRAELADLAAATTDRARTLFRPGIRYTRNTVVDIVRRSQGSTTVTTQRMRATWIVDRLMEGMPMHELIYASGVRSLDAFTRYEAYLPVVTVQWGVSGAVLAR